MGATAITSTFVVWGIDQVAYGPVELPTLIEWVKDERVTADTWVFAAQSCAWQKAGDMENLKSFFSTAPTASAEAPPPTPVSVRGIQPRSLRRIKILAMLSDEQLERFSQFVEVDKVPQWKVMVKQGEPGDSMYFILDGELRVRMNVMGKETILATLGPGDFFGDISLFDRGPRSADVVANVDSTIVKFTAGAFEQLARQAPDLATPLLRAIGKTLTARIRADNKRFGDSVKFSMASR